ncbi:MAG: DUF460 domain-containing protein [Nanoarchaeota archaeon]
MHPLIIGIDPGTTTAYAVLDLSGNIITVSSSKALDIKNTLAELLNYGKPVVVGCDKAKVPWFVDKICRSFGARLAWPREDLKKEEKKALVREQDYRAGNTHELDALSSALFAFDKYKSLFIRIDRFLQEKNLKEYAEQLKVFLVQNEDINMNAALEYLVNKNRQKESRIKKRLHKGEFQEPYKKVRSMESIAELLKEKIEGLQEENKQLRQRIAKLEGKLKTRGKEQKEQLLREKEARIISLSRQLETRNKELSALEHDKNALVDFFSSMDEDAVVLKKLKNLSSEEYTKKQFLNLHKGDILLIDNPNIANEKVVKSIRENVEIIICKEKPMKKIGFIFLDASGFSIREQEHFALIQQQELNKALSQQDVLTRVLDDYRKERKQLE